MTDIAERSGAIGATCRHFRGRFFLTHDGEGREACEKGYPIRKTVVGANGGSEVGIAFMLPCRPGPERKATCPHYDAKTPEEVAEDNRRTDEMMRQAMKLMAAASVWKRTMLVEKRASAVEDCPSCGGVQTVSVSIALGYNNHMACQCKQCGAGFRE